MRSILKLPCRDAGLSGAFLNQVSLNLKLLIGRQINLGAEGLIAGQADDEFSVPGCDQQALSNTAELTHMANELSIYENRSAIGCHGKLDFRKNGRHPEPRVP
jgi:hypothetical protein